MSANFTPKKDHGTNNNSWFESLNGTKHFPERIKTILCCAECGTGNIRIDISEDLILIVTCLECGQEMYYGE